MLKKKRKKKNTSDLNSIACLLSPVMKVEQAFTFDMPYTKRAPREHQESKRELNLKDECYVLQYIIYISKKKDDEKEKSCR